MSDEQVRVHFEAIRKEIEALQLENGKAWDEIEAALQDLLVIHEQMQTSVEVSEIVQEELFQQNQQLAERYQHYLELFQLSPIAYLVTDTQGLILEANQAIAHLLNMPQLYLIGKPLAVYVADSDRSHFRTQLNRLAQNTETTVWQINLSPRDQQPIAAECYVRVARDPNGLIENLKIGVYAVDRSPAIAPHTPQPIPEQIPTETVSRSPLPQSLDGLRVLVVDDEADVREFITAILEPYGVGVKAVASAAAALDELEQFRPDVLVSDIRMPGEDGYRLIQRIREWEADRGIHLPAAAITAYLDEDREKAIRAGFEAYLHKLAQPTELVELVAQLAGRMPQ